jgi:predicted RNase H-like nuclease (RuvC/YqgF family)
MSTDRFQIPSLVAAMVAFVCLVGSLVFAAWAYSSMDSAKTAETEVKTKGEQIQDFVKSAQKTAEETTTELKKEKKEFSYIMKSEREAIRELIDENNDLRKKNDDLRKKNDDLRKENRQLNDEKKQSKPNPEGK